MEYLLMTIWNNVDKETIHVTGLIRDLALHLMNQTISPEIYPDYTDFRGDMAKDIDLIQKMCVILEDNYKVKYKK